MSQASKCWLLRKNVPKVCKQDIPNDAVPPKSTGRFQEEVIRRGLLKK